jgi:hypothetical protein
MACVGLHTYFVMYVVSHGAIPILCVRGKPRAVVATTNIQFIALNLAKPHAAPLHALIGRITS